MTKRRQAVFWLAAGAGLVLFSQTIWAHRTPPFLPAEPPLESLPQEDPETLTLQTGLSPAALEELLEQGEPGRAVIEACQAALFAERPTDCRALFGGIVTREDRLAEGTPPTPLTPLKPGDLLVTFSTHTLGWHHGHAGLVLDENTVLEACQPGMDSAVFSVQHWQTYSQFLILRVRDASLAQQTAAAEFAREHLTGRPYRFLCGVWDSGGGHCAYLPWRAWDAVGYDLDGDGGRIVTVADLTASPQLAVVQVSGLDPALFSGRWAT